MDEDGVEDKDEEVVDAAGALIVGNHNKKFISRDGINRDQFLFIYGWLLWFQLASKIYNSIVFEYSIRV